jgi:hypothetical protein
MKRTAGWGKLNDEDALTAKVDVLASLPLSYDRFSLINDVCSYRTTSREKNFY